MDRRVKERLVGAAILVAVVVLVVPELLPGPARPAVTAAGRDSPVAEPRDPMRTVTVDLSQNPQASEPPVAAPESAPGPQAPASAAPSTIRPAVAAPALETPTSAPKSLHETAETVPSAPPAHAAVAAATRGAWAVQLGSFKDRGNALKLARHWKAKGYAAYLSTTGSGPRALHRVRIGPYADRGAALHAIAALASHGARANLVPPGR